MQIHTLVVTPFQQNARIVVDDETGIGAVIDPGGEAERIVSLIQDQGIKIESIILTHCHIDHAGGVAAILDILETLGPRPTLYGHRIEKKMRLAMEQQAMMFGLPGDEYHNCPEPDVFLGDNDTLTIGELKAQVLFTPGHSPGHLAFYFGEVELEGDRVKVLLAGDALFQGSIGRTDIPGADHETLIRSIREKIFTLPSDTLVLPGHGPNTTVGIEKSTNPFFV